MADYEETGETIILIGGVPEAVVVKEDLVSNPEVTMPLGDYESLRVKTALVRSSDYNEKEAPRITQSEDAYKVVKDSTVEPQECMYVLLMDAGNYLLGVHEVSRGGKSSATVEPGNVFQAAIITNAVGVIVAHNHPSGNPKPSPEDIMIARAIAEVGSQLGIRVLDFIVVGHESYKSLADEGVL